MTILPSYADVKRKLNVDNQQLKFIENSREKTRQILNGEDSRLLLIVGPCSIHDRISAIEFARNMRQLADSLSSHFFLIMRVYCEKPRTGLGWGGYLYDPHLDGSSDIRTGIEWTRRLLLELATLEVPAATEFMHPLTAFYYDDLISWGSIGARTASSPVHRQLASELSMPIGIKNDLHGNISVAVNGIAAAAHSHTFIRLGDTGGLTVQKTKGNPDCHIVLRGGETGPNYDPNFVSQALDGLKNQKLPLRLLVDCSHQNSEKDPYQQPIVFQSTLRQIMDGNTAIRGFLFESHLHAGRQELTQNSPLKYGVSVTDACLDWDSTARLFLEAKEQLEQQFSVLEDPSMLSLQI
jgi:3-deoxy-7-phosphoheptulonate synthase